MSQKEARDASSTHDQSSCKKNGRNEEQSPTIITISSEYGSKDNSVVYGNLRHTVDDPLIKG